MSAKVKYPMPITRVSPSQMRAGQVGTIFYGGEKVLILRTYDEVVDLNRPVRTWESTVSFDVELLPEGTVIELTVESFKE